ncbi:MAG: DHHW family protein [Eubacteriales bacterium]|nr:DHHW family protein [Eubacteriales bacterium]
MKNKNKITIIISFLIIIFFIMIFVFKKEDFSESENRYLKKFPKVSIESIMNGDFSKDLYDHFSDHFPFRDFFITLKSEIDIFIGKKEINNVYISSDKKLFDICEKPKNIEKIKNVFNLFFESINTNTNFYTMIVPSKNLIYNDQMPKYNTSYDQNKIINYFLQSAERENFVDLRDTFFNEKENNTKDLYYNTDHHWTTYGAYIAYKKLMEVMDEEAVEYNEKEVDNNFYGTTYSKVNLLGIKSDTIYVHDYKESIKVKYDNIENNSLYNYDYLNKKDKYSLFLDNLHSFVEIENLNFKQDKELVIIKDSYANCFIPFLLSHYKNIYIFDPRSYHKSIKDFIEDKKIEDVLILYNANTIDTDLGALSIY